MLTTIDDQLDDESDQAADDDNDGLPSYASARTHRLNYGGSFADYAASLAQDRREWERDEYGIDEQ